MTKHSEAAFAAQIGAAPAAQQPQFIEATFAGDHFTTDKKLAQYKCTVKIPVSALSRDDVSPIGLFKYKLAAKPTVLGSIPGFNGVRVCTLVATSALPPLPDKYLLPWLGKRADLVNYAKQRKMNINFEYHETADKVRWAINTYQDDPTAYAKWAERYAKSAKAAQIELDDEFAALGY